MTVEIPYNEIKKEVVYIGIDVHLRSYAVTAIKSGVVIKRWHMESNGEQLVDKIRKYFPYDEIHTVYEAGFSGFVLHRYLESQKINNIVVDPGSIAVVKGNRVKTDKIDSKKLADFLSRGMLQGIRIPSEKEEFSRQLNRSREQLIKQRTRLMNQIRRRLIHFGYLTNITTVLSIKHIEEVLKVIPESPLRQVTEIFLNNWKNTEEDLKRLNSLLREQADKCPFEQIYRTVPGIGKVTSRVLSNELGDMRQFKNEKVLFSYVGLTPSEHSSGEKVVRGRITRQGNPLIRKVLTEAAWVAIKKDKSLHAFYSKLSARAGAKKAIVAVARKLIGKARALFRKNEFYILDKAA